MDAPGIIGLHGTEMEGGKVRAKGRPRSPRRRKGRMGKGRKEGGR